MLIERGHSPEWVVSLDMLAFGALVASSSRVKAARALENLLCARAAAQADGPSFKKIVKPYEKAATAGLVDETQKLKKTFGGGF